MDEKQVFLKVGKEYIEIYHIWAVHKEFLMTDYA